MWKKVKQHKSTILLFSKYLLTGMIIGSLLRFYSVLGGYKDLISAFAILVLTLFWPWVDNKREKMLASGQLFWLFHVKLIQIEYYITHGFLHSPALSHRSDYKMKVGEIFKLFGHPAFENDVEFQALFLALQRAETYLEASINFPYCGDAGWLNFKSNYEAFSAYIVKKLEELGASGVKPHIVKLYSSKEEYLKKTLYFDVPVILIPVTDDRTVNQKQESQ